MSPIKRLGTRCMYVDARRWFFTLLAEKLGNDFVLLPFPLDDAPAFPECDVVIVGLPDTGTPEFGSALSTLQRLASTPPGVPVIAFIKSTDHDAMRDALAAGAYDYFVESSSMDDLRVVLRRAAQFHQLTREAEHLRRSAHKAVFSSVITCDPKMIAICRLASKVAANDANILITGETGTGKELFARAIHAEGPRANSPFVAVACSSLPETLIEAELFGHEKGAFTGAVSARKGRFEAAENGTIFLDEIGELSGALQVKLLRVLQERTFERLGSNTPRTMTARVICATNRDLSELVGAGKFRLDLYYRLNTIEIALPPLRQRRDDIAILSHEFLQAAVARHRRPARRIRPSTLVALEEYDWPGNIRELQNVIERAVVLCDGTDVQITHLPERFWGWTEGTDALSLEDEVRAFKRRLIQRTLLESGNNKVRTARVLRIARSTLHRLLGELEISDAGPDEDSAEDDKPEDVESRHLRSWMNRKNIV